MLEKASQVFGWVSAAMVAARGGVGMIGTGVGILRKVDGTLVAVAYGGHRQRLEKDAVVRAVRAALAPLPMHVGEIRIVVDDDGKATVSAAERKRARRASRGW